jgi:hypothetical protein
MDDSIKVGVFRRLDNRDEGLPDDSPRAAELHRLRAAALHEAFDSTPGITVTNWGNTDNPKPHEFVELVLLLTNPPVLHAVGTATLAVAKVLGSMTLGESVKEGVKWVFERLRKKQEEGKIESAQISIAPTINVRMDAPKYGAKVIVTVEIDNPPQGATVTA